MNNANDMRNETKWGQEVRPEDLELWQWVEFQPHDEPGWDYGYVQKDISFRTGENGEIETYEPSPGRYVITFDGDVYADDCHAIRTAKPPGEPWPEVKPDPLDPETWPTASEAFPDIDFTEQWPSAEGVLAWVDSGEWHYGILSEVDEVKPIDRILILKP